MKAIKKLTALLVLSVIVSSSIPVVYAKDLSSLKSNRTIIAALGEIPITTPPAVVVDVIKPTLTLSEEISGTRHYLVISAYDNVGIGRVIVGGNEIPFSKDGGTYKYEITKTGTYKVVVFDEIGNIVEKEFTITVKNDKSPEVTLSKKYKNSDWYLVIKAEDDTEISRVTVNGYAINFNKNGGTVEYKVTQTDTYRVVVTDNAGKEVVETLKIDVTLRDEKPTLELSKKYKNSDWHLVIKASDTDEITKVTVNGSTINFKKAGETVDYKVTKTDTYKVVVTDNSDNTTTDSLYIDVSLKDEKPELTLSKEYKNLSWYLVIKAKDNEKISRVAVNGTGINFSEAGGTVDYRVTATNTYQVTVTDNMDNTTTESLYIDTTPPVTTQRVVFTQNSKVWYKDGSRQTAMDVAPTLLNARIYLPLRYVAYALGIDESNVAWDSTSKTATILDGANIVQVKLNSKTMTVNGTPITMDTAPAMISGRMMLPISQISKAFKTRNVAINWDNSSKQATIKSNK